MASCSAVKAEEESAQLKAKAEEDLAQELQVLSIDPDLQNLLDRFYADVSNSDTEPAVVGAKCESEFFSEDPEFQKKLREGGTNPSASVNQWARNRLDAFRKSQGWDYTTPFEELPKR
jgi:hypothetical protein